MPARVIDGRAAAALLRAEFVPRIEMLRERRNVVPGLAVILGGNNAASAIYVSNKVRECQEIGIRSFRFDLEANIDTDALVSHIEDLNAEPAVHGILVQLPLPAHVNMRRVLETIAIHKDVDGFHLYNVGGLVVGSTIFSLCTPCGVVKLLEYERIRVEGQNVVVVGASNIVGKPMALILMQRDATVCICHAKTRELAQFTILADILIVAAGRPRLIFRQMVKTGAVVIDVGINRMPDGSIAGDFEYEGVAAKAAYSTPVPGGVGPMTITMLIENTIAAAEHGHA